MGKQRWRLGDYWLDKRQGSANWCRCWYDPKSGQVKRASLGTKDFEEAKDRLTHWFTVESDIKEAPEEEMPLATVLTRYYEGHAKHKASAETAQYAIGYFTDYFGESVVADIVPRKVEAFVRHLEGKGKSISYIRRILGVGRAALHYAYRNRELKTVPYLELPPKELEGQRERILTMEEAAALFDAAKSDHQFMFLMLLFNTLSRPGAITDLTLFQVDFKHRLIDLNPPGRKQSKKYRPVVPITNTLMPWLRQAEAGPLVHWHGKPIKYHGKGFAAMRDRAKLGGDVSAYTIRHTMATELRRREVSQWELAGLMGHRVDSMSERYAKFDPARAEASVKAIDAYFKELQALTHKRLIFGPVLVSSLLGEE